ncbi:MAG: DUF533 domain-containing protein [Planctomycetota bacterium]|nr:DUF533 domain-containing protein [Planctomycetota bacterium]
MNPFDILTEILNAGAGAQQQPQGGGQRRPGPSGVDILKDILGGGPAAGRDNSTSGGVQFPGVLKEGRGGSSKAPSASELEDMLGVGNKSAPAPTQQRQQAPAGNSGGAGDIFGQPQPKQSAPQLSQAEQEQMVFLIRAMIYAGKADGRIDAKEQQAILERIGNTNESTVQFLRHEFSNATSVRDFAWSVPLGMEAAVYASSLSTIDVDTKEEIEYLRELAHGLRLQPKLCNQIHQQYGVKPIF